MASKNNCFIQKERQYDNPSVAAGKKKTKGCFNQRRRKIFRQAVQNFKKGSFLVEKTLLTNANFKLRYNGDFFIEKFNEDPKINK